VPSGFPLEQRTAGQAKGRRSIEFGAAWCIGGLLVAVVTFGQVQGAGVDVVIWGPLVYGLYRIVAGLQLVRKSRGASRAGE
jgi:uncharacterized membrane protein